MVRHFRRRTGGWWALFLCAALAMGCYITFDVLDVDESDLPFQLNNLGAASNAQKLEAEEALQQLPALVEHPDVAYAVFLSRSEDSFVEPAHATPRVALPVVSSRLDRFRPRARLTRKSASVSSSTSQTDVPA